MTDAPDARKTILVADDDSTTRHAVSNMLRSVGYAVTAAQDGAEARAENSLPPAHAARRR